MSHVQKMLSKRNPGYDGEKKYPDVLERISLHAEIKVSKIGNLRLHVAIAFVWFDKAEV